MRVFMSRSFSLYNTEGAGGGAKKETMEKERVRHRHTHCSRRILLIATRYMRHMDSDPHDTAGTTGRALAL